MTTPRRSFWPGSALRQLARKFAATGATQIRLVDVEGARDGTTPNLQLIRRIAAETGLFVEVGGGIRNMDIARAYLENGVSRVILGTAAVTDPDFLQNALDTWGERVAVGADLRDGQVAIRGWQQTSDEGAQAFFDRMQGLGVSTMICTDISRDGAMRGANLELYRSLAKRQGLQIVASGGVSSLDDIKALRDLDLYGAILGKAYYTGAVDLAEALEAAK